MWYRVLGRFETREHIGSIIKVCDEESRNNSLPLIQGYDSELKKNLIYFCSDFPIVEGIEILVHFGEGGKSITRWDLNLT